MSSLDFDLDGDMNSLEAEWREVYEAGILAYADYRCLAAGNPSNETLLDLARQRLARAEILKARIMAKIECLEENLLGQD